ncbi:hypothetical protein SPRG_03224 [Saprolegnia parasitica CBS 223.65]|uniref:Uncharacterized protein n=1 Tax=Saprolegnia parasitica (strain CBS 223.65) TaxID=695850 RepID=A0A067CYW5_SAPPC|nr:hypothetical protein SPRG_03224 [Saprolegnia parasitica CBS 223.65]KDO32007.1 hypothetical protein SPRG_03224 [Saprolegnia parasitica CBS 223.65]|eukprot:XP_012197201.1 hypothetical protein SPRG_03224 [Saprolegnia parasitica CBS 223.65]
MAQVRPAQPVGKGRYPSGAATTMEQAAKLATTERDVAIEEAAAALVQVHATKEECRVLKEELARLQKGQPAAPNQQLLNKLWSVVHKIHGANYSKAQLYQVLLDHLGPSTLAARPISSVREPMDDASSLATDVKREMQMLVERSEASMVAALDASHAQLHANLQVLSTQLSSCGSCTRFKQLHEYQSDLLTQTKTSYELQLQAFEEKIGILFQQLEHEQQTARASDATLSVLNQLKSTEARVRALEAQVTTTSAQWAHQARAYETRIEALRDQVRVLEHRLEHEQSMNLQLHWEMERKASKELDELTKTNTELGQEFYIQSKQLHEHEAEIRELTKTVEWLQEAWQGERAQRLHYEHQAHNGTTHDPIPPLSTLETIGKDATSQTLDLEKADLAIQTEVEPSDVVPTTAAATPRGVDAAVQCIPPSTTIQIATNTDDALLLTAVQGHAEYQHLRANCVHFQEDAARLEAAFAEAQTQVIQLCTAASNQEATIADLQAELHHASVSLEAASTKTSTDDAAHVSQQALEELQARYAADQRQWHTETAQLVASAASERDRVSSRCAELEASAGLVRAQLAMHVQHWRRHRNASPRIDAAT